MERYIFKIYSFFWHIPLVFFMSNAVYSQVANPTENIITVTKKAFKAYEVRNLVIDEILKTHPIRQQVADYWRNHGNFKDVILKPADHGFAINLLTGVIKIDLTKVYKAFSPGDHISMHPEIYEGYIDWQCYSNVNSNLVPKSCQ
jgi:hypothetical protein